MNNFCLTYENVVDTYNYFKLCKKLIIKTNLTKEICSYVKISHSTDKRTTNFPIGSQFKGLCTYFCRLNEITLFFLRFT